MSKQQRPPLTENCEKLVESIKEDFTFKLIHEAEKHTLKENRKEISEADITKAKTVFPWSQTFTDKRKWLVRIALGAMIGFIIMQFQAFSELPNIPLILQFRLFLPTIAMLIWMLLFSFWFREDLS